MSAPALHKIGLDPSVILASMPTAEDLFLALANKTRATDRIRDKHVVLQERPTMVSTTFAPEEARTTARMLLDAANEIEPVASEPAEPQAPAS